MTNAATDQLEEDRPLRVDAERNRRAILAAADRLFAERGFDVPMTEIAAAAGVGRATLHRNFSNRHDLALALIEDSVREIRDFADGLEGEPGDLERILDRKLDHYTRSSNLADALRLYHQHRDFGAERTALVESFFRAAQPDIALGNIRADCTCETFEVMLYAISGVMHGGGTDSERRNRARILKTLLLDGLRTR